MFAHVHSFNRAVAFIYHVCGAVELVDDLESFLKNVSSFCVAVIVVVGRRKAVASSTVNLGRSVV